jgi:hypothetical protein
LWGQIRNKWLSVHTLRKCIECPPTWREGLGKAEATLVKFFLNAGN